MWGEDSFDQGHDVGAVEDVKLGGILFKDLCEGEPLSGPSSIAWGVEGDVGRGCRKGIGGGRFDGYETLCGRGACGGWPEAKVDLEKAVWL